MPAPADRPRYEQELAELRQALELPTVGHPRRADDLAELRRLIQTYTDEAEQIISERDKAP